MLDALAFTPTTHLAHLAEDLRIRPHPVGDGYWARRDRPELSAGRVLTVFGYVATWDFQERHPTGDELAYVLEGEVDLLLDSGAGEQALHLGRGEAGVIPAGSWHRLALNAPATLLFITPVPATTEHRTCRAG